MHILLVDDHPEVRATLAEFLEQLGHTPVEADSGANALLSIRKQRPDLILTDLRMPGMDGLALLKAVEAFGDPPPVALMTAFGDADTAITALRQGAVDYLRKPIDVRELHRLVERFEAPTQSRPAPAEQTDGLLVLGEPFVRVITMADRLHRVPDLPCLIEGETGTGKELVARRIHHGGLASSRPFIALNCAAIAPGLFEAELFGYEAGAYTGAAATGSAGKLALAQHGTLFLDEIGDLPLDQQAKLLRLLEDRAWYPVGGQTMRQLTARVVCATNVGLLERVQAGRFREDLYYRLKVGHVRIPPLRARAEGILTLARSLLQRTAQRRGRGEMRLSPDAEQFISAYAWPGNVREMLHVFEQICILEDVAVVSGEHLQARVQADPARLSAAPPAQSRSPDRPVFNLPLIPPGDLQLDNKGCDLDQWQHAIVIAALAQNDGSPGRTAAFLGISRKVLYTLRKRYGALTGDAVGEE